ncbi:MAG: heme exporter protein C [Maribacter sp.]|jgi:heme exporter protein C
MKIEHTRITDMDFKKHWWKILAILLVLYSLIAGLLIPLKSGVDSITPNHGSTRDLMTLDVIGYNTHYQDAKELRAWLKFDSVNYITGKNIKVLSQNQLTADFQIPDHLPSGKQSKELTLILDNEIDGYSLLPEAIHISTMVFDSAIGMDTLLSPIGQWENNFTDIHIAEGLSFPYRKILYETIRNLFYHVPLWFGMLIILFASMVYGIMYLVTRKSKYDYISFSLTQVGILYGILGLVTGAIWATWTWGEPWSGDVKQNMSAVAMLIYLAYIVLRSSFDDYELQARISSVYNIFAFATLIPLLFVIPRLYDSLHPGNGGNPGFGGEDLDNTMRMVFYPSIIGWTLLGIWLASLAYRYMKLKEEWMDRDEDEVPADFK